MPTSCAAVKLVSFLFAVHKEQIQGSAKRQSSDLVNSVAAVAFHFCLALPAAFTQPGDHLLGHPCRDRQTQTAEHRRGGGKTAYLFRSRGAIAARQTPIGEGWSQRTRHPHLTKLVVYQTLEM